MNLKRITLSDPTVMRLTIAFVYMSALILIGTLMFSVFEGLSGRDSFYMTTQTMFSVGFGDIDVVTPEGRILTILLIIFGISGFLASVGIIGADLFSRYSRRAEVLAEHAITNEKEKTAAVYRWAESHGIDRDHMDRVWAELRRRDDGR